MLLWESRADSGAVVSVAVAVAIAVVAIVGVALTVARGGRVGGLEVSLVFISLYKQAK